MIDEVVIQGLDFKYGLKSNVYQCSNTILIDTQLDQWRVVVIEWSEKEKEFIDLRIRPYRKVRLYHKNKFGRKNKYHLQGEKTNLYQCYDSIYRHKRWLNVVNKSAINTYQKDYNK